MSGPRPLLLALATLVITNGTFVGTAWADQAAAADAAPTHSSGSARAFPLARAADADLAALTGGREFVAVTDQTLTASNTGNTITADSVTNGPVSLNANAFTGFAGIGNFVINTGNNNNLQGSLSVNIIMAPAN